MRVMLIVFGVFFLLLGVWISYKWDDYGIRCPVLARLFFIIGTLAFVIADK